MYDLTKIGSKLIMISTLLLSSISLAEELVSEKASVTILEETDISLVIRVNGDVSKAIYHKLEKTLIGAKVIHPDVQVTILLNSDGGYVKYGMKMAKMIREYEANTVVAKGDRCYSSCTMIFLGGVKRTSEGKLGYHNAWYQPSTPTCTPRHLVWEFVTGQAYELSITTQLTPLVDDSHLRAFLQFMSSIKNASYKDGNKIIVLPNKWCEKYGVCKK